MLDIKSRLCASVEVFYGVRGKSVSDMPLSEAARRIADEGYGVEVLIAQAWDDRSLPTDETIKQLADICRTAKFMTTHACINTWSPDVLRREILIAACIGIHQMVVHPYTLGFGVDACCSSADEVREICKYALDNGVILALENLGQTGITSMRRSLDMIGADPETTGLGICVDIGHAHRSCASDGIRPEVFLREFRDVIFEVHVDDNFCADDLHLPPGQGSIDWPPVVEAMIELRDDAVICLEIACPAAPIQALNNSREFLQSIADCKLTTG